MSKRSDTWGIEYRRYLDVVDGLNFRLIRLGLSGNEIVLLQELQFFPPDDGGERWASRSWLAERFATSERQIDRWFERLAEVGIVRWTQPAWKAHCRRFRIDVAAIRSIDMSGPRPKNTRKATKVSAALRDEVLARWPYELPPSEAEIARAVQAIGPDATPEALAEWLEGHLGRAA